MSRILSLFALLLSVTTLSAQDDLFDLLDESVPETQTVFATFKGTQLINAPTNETPGKGVLQYVIAHRFGSFTDDYLYNFFGLDNAQIRMQLDYGITDRLNIGIGRSSVLKVADSFVKYKALQQRTGANAFPFSLTLNSSINYRAARYTDGIDHERTDRISYYHTAIFARKWSPSISTLFSPGLVHWNMVPGRDDPNTTLHATLGGRIKLNKRIALTGEFSLMNNSTLSDGSTFTVPGGVGIDIETGGHVFQIHLSNTRAMSNPYWLSRNTFSALDGSLFLGFNISRVFTVR
jgi:hypothetical protein